MNLDMARPSIKMKIKKNTVTSPYECIADVHAHKFSTYTRAIVAMYFDLSAP